MNNQYNQYNQQPNMMNQQPMYNQTPNYNFGMNTQQPNQGNKGGGAFGVIVVLILLVGLVIFLLEYTGKTNFTGLFNDNSTVKEKGSTEQKKEETTENSTKKEETSTNEGSKKEQKEESKKETETNVSAKLQNMCTKIDSEGVYYVSDNEACSDGICYFTEGNNMNYRRCSDGKTGVLDYGEFKSSVILATACANVNSKGNYSDPSVVTPREGEPVCENFICRVTINGKQYTEDCKAE